MWLLRARPSHSVPPVCLPRHGQFRSIRCSAYTRSPALYKETAHGTDEPIHEDDLYRYTRHRWLYNEEAELSKRYVKFNLQKLLETAVHVTHAQHCTKVLKYREGLHNKAFVLTMDNGTEVVAKLPNPNAAA